MKRMEVIPCDRRASIPTLVAVCVVLGCSDAPQTERPGGTTVRDSLGVELVENHGLNAEAAGPVRIGDTPILAVGDRADAEGHDLFRVAGAVRFSDGGLAVANASTSEVRLFSAEGSYEGAAGGAGDGPGEFRALGPMALLPDETLLVLDPLGNARVRFDREGAFLSEDRSAVRPSFVEANILLGDGTRVIRGYDPSAVSHDVRGPQRSESPIVVVPPEGSHPDTVGTWPGRDLLYLDVGAAGGPLGAAVVARPLFQPESVIAGDAVAGVWVVGDQRQAHLQVWDSRGSLLRHVRWFPEAREPTSEDLSLLRDERLANAGQRRAALARALDEFPEGNRVPIFRRVVVDREGRLWVERYPLPSDDHRLWWIFSSDGRWLGNLSTADELAPLEIGSGYLMALERDEFDVERVVVWPLEWGVS